MEKMKARDLKREAEIEARIRILFPKKPPPVLSEGHPALMSWEELTRDFPHDKDGDSITPFGCVALKSIVIQI